MVPKSGNRFSEKTMLEPKTSFPAFSLLVQWLHDFIHPVTRAAAVGSKSDMDANFDHAAEDFWVFGYGSLMWRPGFAFVERAPARVVGLHRSLCVYSFVHRGTPEKPGLVLGLDRGGACRGIAYLVAAKDRANVLSYLRAREQVTAVYRETVRVIWLAGKPERRVDAVCYLADHSHPQYAGRLTLDQQLHYVLQGHGKSGADRDYVLEATAALEALGVRDRDLHLLAERLKGTHAIRAVKT
jgi:cation transport protein ChaC